MTTTLFDRAGKDNLMRMSQMNEGPNIVRIAAMIGDHARAEMLTALMGGRALTATELADTAGITKQTGSAHLRKLLDARLVAMEAHGRHRYYRVADEEVAHLLESLMGVAFSTRVTPEAMHCGPAEPALRKARICYDHLAGELGVLVYEGLRRQGAFNAGDSEIELSEAGRQIVRELGIDISVLVRQKRTLCRVCMDWSERRHHLAGALGAALLDRIIELRWAARDRRSRVIRLRPDGEKSLRAFFQP